MRSLKILAGLVFIAAPALAAPLCPVPDLTKISHDSGTTGTMKRVDLQAKYPQAICNDGTSGAYFIAPGLGTSAHRWVIVLEGGGACTGLDKAGNPSNAACAGRGNLVKVRTPGTGQGILSSDPGTNPDFYDATKVFVSYCSSDYWTGMNLINDPDAKKDFTLPDYHTWSFGGRYILDAAITDLLATTTAATMPTEVLYTGTSAGGLGVLESVSRVAPRFQALPNMRFVAAADAGYAIRVRNFDPANPPYYQASGYLFDKVFASGFGIWGGPGDANCVTASGQPMPGPVQCLEPEYILANQFIHEPLLIEQSRMDTAQLGDNGVATTSRGVKGCSATNYFAGTDPAASAAYAQCFAYQMQQSIMTNAVTPNAPLVSAFAPDQLIHVESTCTKLFTTKYSVSQSTAMLSDRGAIHAWYLSPCGGTNWQQTPPQPPTLCPAGVP